MLRCHPLDDKQPRIRSHRHPTIAQNLDTVSVVPVVQHALQQIGVGAVRYRLEETPGSNRTSFSHSRRRKSLCGQSGCVRKVEQHAPHSRVCRQNRYQQFTDAATHVDDPLNAGKINHLRDRRRNVLGELGKSTGRRLFDGAVQGGAQALARSSAAIAPGQLADLAALNPSHPALAARKGDALLDSWLFSGDGRCVQAVWVAGRKVVAGGRHTQRDAIAARFLKTMHGLLA